MTCGTRTVYPSERNKGFSSTFQPPEESRRVQRPKRCTKYGDKDDDNSPSYKRLFTRRPKPAKRIHLKKGRQLYRYQTIRMEQRHSEAVLKQLAQKLLSEQENKQFKLAIHEFQQSHSLTTLCSQLKNVINTPERLVLLVELSYLVPPHLSNDFHRLCSLQFHNYGKALQTCRPGTLPRHESSRIIAQDSSGKSRIVSQGNFKQLVINSSPDLRHSSRISQNSNGSRSFDDIDESTSAFDSFWDVSLSPRSYRKFDSHYITNTGKMAEAIYGRNRSPGYEQTNGYTGRKNEITLYEDSMGLSITKIPDNNTSNTMNRKKNLRRVYILRNQSNLGLSLKGGSDDRTPVTIDWVEEGSLAHQQGLKAGDRILEVNGHDFSRITHDAAVKIMLMSSELGLLVESDDSEHGRFDSFNRHENKEEDITIFPSPQGRIGCVITRDGITGHEVIVKSIVPNSPASKAGLNIGDHVLKIDGIDVSLLTEKQVVSLATSSNKVKLRIGKAPYYPLRNSSERNVSPKLRSYGSETHYLPYESYTPLNRVYSFDCLSPVRSSEHGSHIYYSYQRPGSAHALGSYPHSHTGYRKITASSRSGPAIMSKGARQHATHSTTYLRSVSHRLEDLHLSGHYETRSARSAPAGRLYHSRSSGAINFLSDFEETNRKSKYGHLKNQRVTSSSSSPSYYMSDSDSWHLY